ncbi:MAG: hypothetical protein M3546_15225 [Actinomycetota bacterium]|nr:hypothetical protein [Actinomycetota bacterium]
MDDDLTLCDLVASQTFDALQPEALACFVARANVLAIGKETPCASPSSCSFGVEWRGRPLREWRGEAPGGPAGAAA